MSYELIVIGGGVTGSSLASRMASSGARVLIVEREPRFRDRIRGEALQPWGVAEARKLGISEVLQGRVAELLWFDQILNGELAFHRDLAATTVPGQPMWGFYHPDAQEVLLSHAAACGAEVLCAATLERVVPGPRPKVMIAVGGEKLEYEARLVALCGGRNPIARSELGFTVRRGSIPLLLSGVRLGCLSPQIDPTIAYVANDTKTGCVAGLFPQPEGYARAYFGYHPQSCGRIQGDGDFSRFREMFIATAGKAIAFGDAQPLGPLASFECADVWVDHPYRDGVALLGDAAASSDPSWGQGLSLGFRAARILSDELLADSDWDAAAHRYAKCHDRDYGAVRTVTGWFYDIFQDLGPQADIRRFRALPLIAADPTRVPDVLFSGPEFPLDGRSRARFFGDEDEAQVAAAQF
jgi:2-polyprenyl-6-methoxyphenol hydroxylase-like FAD-dependent oxidoreductase